MSNNVAMIPMSRISSSKHFESLEVQRERNPWVLGTITMGINTGCVVSPHSAKDIIKSPMTMTAS